MTIVHAWAAGEANGRFEPYEYTLDPIRESQVDIDVESCGLCHSDLSMLENVWELTKFPFVPGHEVVGTVSAVGDHVAHLSVGDRVGLGWHSGYCMTCDECLSGHHNLCRNAEPTVVGRHGGFADVVRAEAASVVKLPNELDPKTAGPLLCGGMAVFGPLVGLGVSPTSNVAVVGIGGLGHLALQFARAWGCDVTAFTSPGKEQEAIELGAHDTVNSRDPSEVAAAAGRFDLVLSTVNVPLDWNAYLATLKPRGRLHMVGAVTEPLGVDLVPMMFDELSLGSSPVGSPATIRQMLRFAARHDIRPVTEHFPMGQVNDAFERLRSGRARFRVVLDGEAPATGLATPPASGKERNEEGVGDGSIPGGV